MLLFWRIVRGSYVRNHSRCLFSSLKLLWKFTSHVSLGSLRKLESEMNGQTAPQDFLGHMLDLDEDEDLEVFSKVNNSSLETSWETRTLRVNQLQCCCCYVDATRAQTEPLSLTCRSKCRVSVSSSLCRMWAGDRKLTVGRDSAGWPSDSTDPSDCSAGRTHTVLFGCYPASALLTRYNLQCYPKGIWFSNKYWWNLYYYCVIHAMCRIMRLLSTPLI